MVRKPPASTLIRRLADLQHRLHEVEDTLDAIRSGSVDALVVHTPRGEQLFTLRGADQTYRALVEAMNEGAVTLNQGLISYCNHQFSRMARSPLEKIFGTPIHHWITSSEFLPLLKALDRGKKARGSLEAHLRTADGIEVPVLVSAGRFSSDGKPALSLVVTDITERKAAERARRELSRRILNAQELERQRVARDLHDGVNQLLSSAKYRLSASCKQPPATARESVHQARMLLEKAIAEVRLIGRNLRPSELDDLGLVAALRSLAHEFQTRCGVTARLRCGVIPQLSSELEMALYRVAQEALNNVAKHSRASRAEIVLTSSNGTVTLSVRDNGTGFKRDHPGDRGAGWGLKNMRERAALLGGVFSVGPCANRGIMVRVILPLAAASRNGDQRV